MLLQTVRNCTTPYKQEKRESLGLELFIVDVHESKIFHQTRFFILQDTKLYRSTTRFFAMHGCHKVDLLLNRS